MESSTPESLISDVHAQCFFSFVALISAIKKPVRDFRDQTPSLLEHVQESFDQYKLWAGNVGAAHAGKRYQISLDYRLREAPFYKTQVLKLLGTLNNTVQKALLLIQDKRTPFEELPSSDPHSQSNPAVSALNDSDDQDGTDDSPWELSDDGSNTENQLGPLDEGDGFHTKQVSPARDQQPDHGIFLAQRPSSEMPSLLESIKFVVICLYKMPIRRPAPLNRLNHKASVEASYYQPFDILYVKDKFPHLDSDVAARLGKMITRRRQLLFYRHFHEQRLKPTEAEREIALVSHSATTGFSPEDNNRRTEAMGVASASQIARSQIPSTDYPPDTLATTVRNNALPFEDTSILYAPSTAESKTSMASSYADENIRVEVPPRPKGENGKELDYFKCDYCLVTQFIKTDHAWKKHVFRDLQPYVCTFSDCDLSDQIFESRDEWHKHEIQCHRIEWFCNVYPHPHYAEKADFLAHMKSSHYTRFDDSPLSLLSGMFSCPSQRLDGICNLCRKPSVRLKTHISRHLEQIALFALPRIYEEAGDNTENANGSIDQESSHYEKKQLKPTHLDSQTESSSSNDTHEQQLEGSDIDDIVDQDIIPDSEDPHWDMMAVSKVSSAVSSAKVFFMVPFQRNEDLVGREYYIQSIEAKLCIPNKHCRVALVGLGGIGKKRIALEYAFYHKNSGSISVFWIHASTAERMKKDYQEIAKAARLVGAEDPKVDQLELVKKWLESKTSGDWMMVIDSADDEELFFGQDENQDQGLSSSLRKLARYFPQRPNGSILLTTRNRMLGIKFATVRGVITVPEMSASESKKLLMEKLEEDSYNDDDLTDIVEVLENLPLALVQAAAFIRENSQSIGEYVQMYRESDLTKIKLLSQDFEEFERDPDSKNPVAVTWAISFGYIRKNDHRAAGLLSLMSVLDRQAIPKSLLPSDKEEVELEKALGTLKAYSLIAWDPRHQTFNLNRLVYLATRNWLTLNAELGSWMSKALILLSERFPVGTYENREIWMAYLPHAHSVLESDQLPAGENIAQAKLLFNVSGALQEKGDYDSAELMARKSLDLREKSLGKSHVETLSSLIGLGSVLWRQGKYNEAERAIRQALEGFEGMLGIEHPETLRSVENLGLVLVSQGKYVAAEELHRRALSAREKILGKEHPDTLTSISNLALVLGYQGKYEAAEKLNRLALIAREKIMGEEHPDTLTSINSLALVLDNQGKYEAAENLFRRALNAAERILGEEHPDTLRSVNNLGLVLDNQGKRNAAENLFRRALIAKEKVLGEEHPDTLISINNLGLVLANQGKYEAAENLLRRALNATEKILGKGHPDTLRTVNNLADVLQKQDQVEEAMVLYQQTLMGRERTLGQEHPDTLSSVADLAVLFHQGGKYQQALTLYQKACAGLEKTLGPDHPLTQRCAEHYEELIEEMSQDPEVPDASVIGEETGLK